MGFLKQLLIKANFETRRAELMLKSDKVCAYKKKPRSEVNFTLVE